MQQPTSVSLALIAGMARDHGLKVLLSGEGADELFGGYTWHRSYKNSLSGYSSPWRPSNTASRCLPQVRLCVGRSGQLSVLQIRSSAISATRTRWIRLRRVGPGEPIHGLSLVGQDFQAWPRWQQALRSYEWMPDRKEADVQSFMLNNMRVMMQPLLHRLDRMLMMHSIEGRVPFLESAIFKFALNLGLQHKIRGPEGKRVLKQVAARYLPSAIVNRKKMGFTVPWLSYANKFPKILDGGFVSEWTRLARRPRVLVRQGTWPTLQVDRRRSVGSDLRSPRSVARVSASSSQPFAPSTSIGLRSSERNSERRRQPAMGRSPLRRARRARRIPPS